MSLGLPERVESKIVTVPACGCWLWVGKVNGSRYGSFWDRGRWRGAHRVVYELERGKIPVGLTLDHLCRVRSCVNPDHLEPVTSVENVRRGKSFSVVNASKTHCVNGHEFTSKNTGRTVEGHRICRACARRHALRYYHEHKS